MGTGPCGELRYPAYQEKGGKWSYFGARRSPPPHPALVCPSASACMPSSCSESPQMCWRLCGCMPDALMLLALGAGR